MAGPPAANASAAAAAAVDTGPAAMNMAIEAALSNLKPLRDLAQNWDIDIASCLEDYLHELVTLGHPPDPRFPNGYNPNAPAAAAASGSGAAAAGEAPPNFAQAALLLQNSSSVYSRKVEYLHALVYQALNDLIASTRNGGNGKNGHKRRGGGNNGTDAILEELTEYDENMEFLLLDDVLPTDDTPDGDRINLREDDANAASANLDLLLDEDDEDDAVAALATPRNNQSLLNATTRLSLGGLSVTRLDRSKAGFSTLAGGAGGAHGGGADHRMSSEAATRALIGTILNEGSDGQGNLRLLSGKCDVSSTGALLMPGSSLLTTASGGAGGNRNSSAGGISINPDSSLFVAESAGDDNVNNNANGDANMMEDGGDDNFAHDDDDDGGVGFALADDDDDDGTFGGRAHQQQQTSTAAPKKVQFAPIPAKKHDPWALLDPHDATSAPKARPLRIGVTYRLPPGVEDTPSECVTGARTKKKKKRTLRKTTMVAKSAKTKMLMMGCGSGGASRALDSFVSVAAYKSSRAAAGANLNGDSDDEEMDEEEAEALAEVASSVSMTGLAFGTEFAYIAKATARREAAARREERKRRQMEEAGLPPPPPSNDLSNNNNFAAFDDDDDDYGGGFAFSGDDDDDDLDENDAGPVRGNVGVTSLDEAISTAGSQFCSGDDAADINAETFEELCRAHLRAFARGAEKYAAETQLSRRVGDWQSRLAPILEEEEQRPEFDIHVYGDRILETCLEEVEQKKAENSDQKLSAAGQSSPSNVVNFRSVTEGEENYEVCRLFLSSLMLCNAGNIILTHEHNGATVATPDQLKIELLQGKVDRPMETYLAPSVAAEQENAMLVQ